jgi:NADH:ubiquinone oxidoreductase subunit 3 (subunit A)
MNIQVIVLLAVIFGAVLALVILPNLIGGHAKRRRRKHVAFDERHNSVDLFQSRHEPPPAAEDPARE